jgi:hypothetical protein
MSKVICEEQPQGLAGRRRRGTGKRRTWEVLNIVVSIDIVINHYGTPISFQRHFSSDIVYLMQPSRRPVHVSGYSNIPLTATAANNKALHDVNTRSLCRTPVLVSLIQTRVDLVLTFFRST